MKTIFKSNLYQGRRHVGGSGLVEIRSGCCGCNGVRIRGSIDVNSLRGSSCSALRVRRGVLIRPPSFGFGGPYSATPIDSPKPGASRKAGSWWSGCLQRIRGPSLANHFHSGTLATQSRALSPFRVQTTKSCRSSALSGVRCLLDTDPFRNESNRRAVGCAAVLSLSAYIFNQ
ncbi:hypothetical protein FA13DRAFT_1140832 [Coprinellus micaceus]|uniref:Uncharacterized protein n=1 Tax=Coprinellus micaceus TaxID=71717 RepID=A0A4Y7SVR1_COPMI|nr:hypothetical protein FA13DRAFT_1140832 [Coprinellus micaceus]